jgi:hypothetical protein
MKALAALLFVSLVSGAVDVRLLEPGTRIDLNGTWEYRPRGEANYVKVPVPQMLNRIQWWLDDSEDFKKWENARLAKLGFDTESDDEGWYRLELDVPALPAGRHVFVEFDGIAMRSRTLLNDHLLGEHTGMFSRFAYDLTPYLKPGRNTLSVWVSMEKAAVSSHPMSEAVTVNLTASKVMTLSKGMFGPLTPNRPSREYDLHGIWQPVRLVVRDRAMLDDVWFIPSLRGAEVRVEAHALDAISGMQVRARWETLGAAGPAPIQKDATLTLRDVHPKLWTPADPNLYKLEVRLETKDGRLLDRITRNVGFRTFEARGNQFYLNGHRYWLRGANQLPYGKNPWDPELPRRLIRMLHDANIRVTRTHATPWNEAWLDAADEIGLGVSIEGIRPWALAGNIGVPPPDIFEHWLMENADVVKRCRNHPSVLIWTVGNEMMLRDSKNIEKWRLLSEVVKQTRRLDTYRPVVASSDYERDPEFYRSVLKPNGIDDGDIDDIHRYRGWYAESPFVTDSQFQTEMRRNQRMRPFIGQEMSTGYPDLDTGLPVLRYTRDLLTPQAWIGQDAYPGKDPSIFLEHNRAVTKRWAEQLRFQRGDQTAGFLLFSTECWFAHSYDPGRATPYPVVEAMRYAWAPVGLALETGRRRFFEGEEIYTAVFVTNDDESFRDSTGLRIEMDFGPGVTLPKLAYYQTARVPVRLTMPKIAAERRSFQLVIRLLQGKAEISRTVDSIEVFRQSRREPAPHSVILLGPDTPASDLASGQTRQSIEQGATAILFSPGKKIVDLFPKDVRDVKAIAAEYADWSPTAKTKLVSGLKDMDIKWWGRKDDWRVFVANEAHRLQPGGQARELIRFIPPHSYISADKVPDQYMTVLFEIPLGKGRLWVCDLDLESSASVDPAARLFERNLLRAAASPE